MPSLKTKEIKLFLTFFILYSIFVHYVGWNEQTRTLGAIAIADYNRLDLGNLAKLTGDRIRYGDLYYSDKSPASSFLALPIYQFAKAVAGGSYDPFSENETLVPQLQFNTTVYSDAKPGSTFLITALLESLLLAALPGAITVALMNRFLFTVGFKNKTAVLTSIAFAAGTIIFSYSTVFTGSTLLTMLAFAALLSFWRGSQRSYFLCGIFLGLAASIDYVSVIFSAAFFLYVLLTTRKDFKNIAAPIIFGALLGVSPAIVYNLVSFGVPFVFYGNYIDPHINPCILGKTYSQFGKTYICPYNQFALKPADWAYIAMELTFRPYRGFLFYMPFLVLPLVGLVWMRKDRPQLAVLVTAVLALHLIILSFYGGWFGGSSFGPKYMLVSLAILSIPMAQFLEKVSNEVLKAATLPLCSLAVFYMLLGTSGFWEGVNVFYYEDPAPIRGVWYGGSVETYLKYNNPYFDLNPLYRHYLPAFLSEGPRSRLLEGIMAGKLPDIRDIESIHTTDVRLLSSQFGIVVLKTSFLPIALILFVISAIWWPELSGVRTLGKPVLLAEILIVASIILISKVGISNLFFGNGWVPASQNDSVRWMKDDATIYIFSDETAGKYINLSLQNYRSNGLEVYVNGDLIGSYSGASSIVEPVIMRFGENSIRLVSVDGCRIPLYEENQLQCFSNLECSVKNISIFNISLDMRCLGFGLRGFGILNETRFGSGSYYYGNNWYPAEKPSSADARTPRFMSQDATLLLPRSDEKIKLNISLDAYEGGRTLELYLNGAQVGTYKVNRFFHTVLTPELDLSNHSVNVLKLHSKEGCSIPAKEGNSTDYRCLSFAVYNVTELEVSKMIARRETVLFGRGWYGLDEYGDWSEGEAELMLLSGSPAFATLKASVQSYRTPKTLDITVDGVVLGSYYVDNRTMDITTGRFYVPAGESVIHLSSNGCGVPKDIEGTPDERCLSILLKNLTIDSSKLDYEGFYMDESASDALLGRVNSSGSIYLANDHAGPYKLRFDVNGSVEAEMVTIYMDGMLMRTLKPTKTLGHYESPITFLGTGMHTVGFRVDGCDLSSGGQTCIGVEIWNFNVTDASNLLDNFDREYDHGWYDLENWNNMTFRWTSGDATFSILNPADGDIHASMSFVAWSYAKRRTLSIEVNGKDVYSLELLEATPINIPINLTSGENTLRFRSTGCDVPLHVEKSTDGRCLSASIKGLSIK